MDRKKWGSRIINVLMNKRYCAICLESKESMVKMNQKFKIHYYNVLMRTCTIQNILNEVFGKFNALSSELCTDCVNDVMKSHSFIQTARTNEEVLHRCINKLSCKTDDLWPNINCYSRDKKFSIRLNLNNIFDVHTYNNTYNDGLVDATLDSDFEDQIMDKYTTKGSHKSKYECTKCNQHLKSFINLENHRKKHQSQAPHICKFCSKRFTNIKDFIQHRRIFHNDNIVYCYICQLVINKDEEKEHISSYHSKRKIICDHCKEMFSDRLSLIQHLLTLPKETQITCKYCLKNFNQVCLFINHTCQYQCPDCSKHSCIHEKYLKSYREQFECGQTEFKCIDCDYSYTRKFQLLVHANKEHLNYFPYVCEVCNEGFTSRDVLVYHKECKHNNCPHCYQSFKDKNTLDSHILLCSSKEKSYKCDLCNEFFNCPYQRSYHRRKHFAKETQCNYCEKLFWTVGEVNSHMKRTHNVHVKKRIYPCTKCKLDFLLRDDMLRHYETHPHNAKHVCRVCNASFESKSGYNVHKRQHNSDKGFACPICTKVYSKFTIRPHIRSHEQKERGLTQPKIGEEDKKYVCDICGKLSLNERSLKMHKRRHQEHQLCPQCLKYISNTFFERHMETHLLGGKIRKKKPPATPYKCDECDYEARLIVILEAHKNRYHLHVRPYKCDTCGKGFYSKFTLRDHIKIHSGTKPEQCEQCGKRFACKKGLMLHLRIHTGEKPYPCDLCEERFLSASRRQEHRTRKHFEPSVQCPICDKMLYTESILRKHLITCHSEDKPLKYKKCVKGL